MNYYISDTHFGHPKAIWQDNRPFHDVSEMDHFIIKRWNQKVRKTDHVYICGDLCGWNIKDRKHSSTDEKCLEWYLHHLNGRKHLIAGNHDMNILKSRSALEYLESVDQIREIMDGDKKIVLCHYPMIEWNGMYSGSYHIYGHVHCAETETFNLMQKKENAFNAGCMLNCYEPVRLSELIRNKVLQTRKAEDQYKR